MKELTGSEFAIRNLNETIVIITNRYGEASRKLEVSLAKIKRLEKVIATTQSRQGPRMYRADIRHL